MLNFVPHYIILIVFCYILNFHGLKLERLFAIQTWDEAYLDCWTQNMTDTWTKAQLLKILNEVPNYALWFNMKISYKYRWNNGSILDEDNSFFTINVGTCGAYRASKYQSLKCHKKRGYVCNINGSIFCYWNASTWDSANKDCQRKGGYLAHSAGSCDRNQDGYWIGLKRTPTVKNEGFPKLLHGLFEEDCLSSHINPISCAVLRKNKGSLNCSLVPCSSKHAALCGTIINDTQKGNNVTDTICLPPVPGRNMLAVQDKDKNTVTYVCREGFYLSQGQHTHYCDSQGRWIGDIPLCKKVPGRTVGAIAVSMAVLFVLVIFFLVFLVYGMVKKIRRLQRRQTNTAVAVSLETTCSSLQQDQQEQDHYESIESDNYENTETTSSDSLHIYENRLSRDGYEIPVITSDGKKSVIFNKSCPCLAKESNKIETKRRKSV